MLQEYVLKAGIASVLACLACGLGALPLLIPGINFRNKIAGGYAFAGGLMYSASVFNLIGPAYREVGNQGSVKVVLLLLLGIGLGCLFLHFTERYLANRPAGHTAFLGALPRRSMLILIAMSFHSLPEGVAVGVGYASGIEHFGTYIAIAIAIHNVPEGMAIAIPHRAEGGSIWSCFWLAVLSSVPQPIAAVPAAIMVWFFRPLLIPSLGFAAGAMMYLVLVELIPEALEGANPRQVAWMFMAGFGLMLLIQAVM